MMKSTVTAALVLATTTSALKTGAFQASSDLVTAEPAPQIDILQDFKNVIDNHD
jgi:hypothetical protein